MACLASRVILAGTIIMFGVGARRHDILFRPPAGMQKIVDMTYDFAEGETLYWPTAMPYNFTVVHKDVVPETGVYYEVNNFCAAEHGGTHVDAPSHFVRNAWAVHVMPVDQIIGEAIVVDVTNKTVSNSDYQVTTSDLKNWEKTYKMIPDGAILLLYTGWGHHWPNERLYFGTDTKDASKLHFPGLHPDAAQWLVNNRKVKAVGLDTASIDHGPSKLFQSHVILFDKNIPVLENVANIHNLPPEGAIVIGLPMKIREGSGAPLRLIALIPTGKGESNRGSDIRLTFSNLIWFIILVFSTTMATS